MRAHPLRLALRLALPLPLAWGLAHAQSAVVPPHQIPAEVLANLQQVQLTFERALEQDCAPERCASKGCVYVSHKVVDQPAVGGLPGLRLQGTGPGASAGQLYLTAVHCGFVHERAVRAADARALAKRLEAKVSQGWTRVEVTAERLEALPEHLRVPPEPPPPPPPDPAPEPEAAPLPPQTWEAPRAAQELWAQLLPHFSWMIAVILLTFAALILIWAARRLGRTSPEEQLLMRQLLADEGAAQEPPPPSPSAPPPQEEGDAKALTEARLTAWRARLSEGEGPDPALEALAADLLRGGEQRLLAKAVMRFPEAFPRALPQGGELASAKLQLAEFIKAADPATLPSDEAFLDALDRYALASSLIAQPDTELMRGLHEEFGPAALTELMIALPPRFAALLFAFAPAQTQREAAATLTGPQRAEVADQLLRSSRVDTAESDYLLSVLAALRAGARLPTPPAASPVPDRGTAF
ncbi:hypothetical protein KKB55_04540, partial [Myxococcota bacterium]|nr:hypothetical protein [Myxococcota bacterium]